MISNIKDDVVLYGQVFPRKLFDYLMSHFKEAFSHSSLSIEEAFKELDDYKLIIETSKDELANQYFELLSDKEKNDILDEMHQMIVFKGSRFGVFNESFNNQEQINYIYNKYFDYFEAYLPYFIKFNDGKYDKIATFHNIDVLFYNLPQMKNAYEKAYNLQRDNLNAFDYAMKLNNINILDVIKINSIVNASDDDINPGFKKTNNDVLGASFTTTDKQNVPIEMQKLFKEYEEDFGIEILDPNEHGISNDEKYRRVCNILKREAIFHIRFIRIHPFSDGNGRTGRIILNHNLLNNGIAPVLITDVMSDDYKECIGNYDIDGLVKILLISSSQQATNWISMKKGNSVVPREHLNNDVLAELNGFDDLEIHNRKSLAR